ncbi:SETMAR [Cordylochernes scorpioides]|uniref:SETMAR n=1 Tax=Cordylochernes scorpioides TaxID=51811 RepID=A0ABY6KYP2_9ARAC|nr:SETMAR [Cordylochernes scorpioides]
MTEVEDEHVADALTNMQHHCEYRVSHLKDAMRGLAAPRIEKVISAPIDISCATNISPHRLEQADEIHREILTLPRQPTSTMSHGNHRKNITKPHRSPLHKTHSRHPSETARIIRCPDFRQKFSKITMTRDELGDFDTRDKERGGRPIKFEDAELEALLDEDSSQTQEELAETFGVAQQAISNRLKVMGMVQKQGNWVPYELKPRNIERRICTCELLLKRQNRKGFLHRIVTGDEKWIHYDNPKRRKSWVKPGHASTSTAKPNIHGKKLMLCIWWDHLGVIYYKLLQPNETITGERYQQHLMRLSRALKIKRPLYAKRHDKVIYQHDKLGHMLQKLSRRLWRRFNGMSYPTRCIHQTLLLQTTTCSVR